jgi:hypothetical protein
MLMRTMLLMIGNQHIVDRSIVPVDVHSVIGPITRTSVHFCDTAVAVVKIVMMRWCNSMIQGVMDAMIVVVVAAVVYIVQMVLRKAVVVVSHTMR